MTAIDGWVEWGVQHARLERDLSITRVRKGNHDHSVFFAFLSVTAFQSAQSIWFVLSGIVLRCVEMAFFFLFVISFAHNRVGASDRRCSAISLIDILVIFHLWLSRQNLL